MAKAVTKGGQETDNRPRPAEATPYEGLRGATTAAFEKAFRSAATTLAAEPEKLQEIRRAAWDAFAAHGLPSTRLESWSRTNLKRVVATEHVVVGLGREAQQQAATGASDDQDAANSASFPDAAAVIVTLDGVYRPELSDVSGIPADVTVTDEPPLDAGFGQIASITGPEATWAAANTALFPKALCIQTAPGTVVERPIHVVHLVSDGSADSPAPAIFPRVYVAAARTSDVSVVESFAGLPSSKALIVPVTELIAEEGSAIRHVTLQQNGFGVTYVGRVASRAMRDAHIETLVLHTGGRDVRHDAVSTLAAEGAETRIDGVFLVAGRQHVDDHTTIDHAVPHATSHETFKGVLDGEGHGVFTGYVLVQEGANGTNSEQENRNLVLSKKALVDTTPQLEIYNDDVKCAHGSTIGRLDEDALFFLQSRGIERAQAARMLTEAFCSEVISVIRHDGLRAHLVAKVTDWFDHGRDAAMAAAKDYGAAPQGEASS